MASRGAAQVANQIVKLIVPAGGASPAPPVGPALGAKGVKSIDFCKEFNARTANLEPNLPIPVIVTIKPNRTFTFETRTPPLSFFLKKAAKIEKGAQKPGAQVSGTISLKHVYEIAKIKAQDVEKFNVSLESVCKSVIGSAKSAGIHVVP